nr:MAG TPA: HTH-type transcriptional regulator [Caudoviricetes sp.]
MKCDVCNGHGWIENKRYYQYSSAEAYERGIQPSTKCKRCGGSGFIIGNLNEALNKLTVAINDRRGLTLRETKELLIFLRNTNK